MNPERPELRPWRVLPAVPVHDLVEGPAGWAWRVAAAPGRPGNPGRSGGQAVYARISLICGVAAMQELDPWPPRTGGSVLVDQEQC